MMYIYYVYVRVKLLCSVSGGWCNFFVFFIHITNLAAVGATRARFSARAVWDDPTRDLLFHFIFII